MRPSVHMMRAGSAELDALDARQKIEREAGILDLQRAERGDDADRDRGLEGHEDVPAEQIFDARPGYLPM